ncbi:cupin domain-containing protein [Methylocapsa acidiphila]|uniref:cupin domain-containing protein n=1 Tax=Methylocapsa acidiphila TaxID=133552 RepID=UPI0004013BC6|nr:cupin domain-containing protein [Methylocapsa acidiphila]
MSRQGDPSVKAAEIIRLLDLRPHPEGGFFRETFRDSAEATPGRAASTLIYFLLDAGQRSHWHRVDAAEAWHYYAGAPLLLMVSQEGEAPHAHRLGADLIAGERPQFVVPAGWWQSAESIGAWTLVGCSVAPGFEFSGFELAPATRTPAPARG